MAFIDLYSEITGCVPKLDVDLAKKLVQRAFLDVQRYNLWSFQLFDANWTSPVVINGGTVTTTQGANTIVFDATASALILPIATVGPFPTPLTQRQFRIGIGTIYNIWAIVNNGGIVTLTLDRPYAEASATASPYMIYQCYYPAPYRDQYAWINVRDMINYNDLDIWSTREKVNLQDPQRTIFYLPTKVVYYQTDQNPASPTYQWPLWELWGQPQYSLTYQLCGIRRLVLVNDTDTLPASIGEDVVIEMSKVKAYEWAEANKGDMPRNAGSDFRFLIGDAKKEYERLMFAYRRNDRNLVDNFLNVRRHRNWLSNTDGYYNSIANSANPGAPW